MCRRNLHRISLSPSNLIPHSLPLHASWRVEEELLYISIDECRILEVLSWRFVVLDVKIGGASGVIRRKNVKAT